MPAPEPPIIARPTAPRPVPTGSRWPALLAWAIILGLVAFIFWRNAASPRNEKDGDLVNELQIKIAGEMAMALKSVPSPPGAPKPPQLAEKTDALVQQLEEYAKTPENKVRAAIIAGEVIGPDEARKRLTAIEETDSSPDLATDIAALRIIYFRGPGALDAAAQDRLTQRYDYFARVALSYGVPKDTEPRKSIEASAQHTLIVLGVLGFLGLLVFLVSLGLFVTAIVLVASGKIRRAYIPDPSANSAFLEGFALFLVLFVGLRLVLQLLDLEAISWEWLVLLLIPVVMFWTARRGATAEQRRNGFGWHCGRGLHIEIPLGIAGYLAGLPIMAVGFIITARLMKYAGSTPTHPIIHMLNGNGWQILALYGAACVMAPVLEETMFRGALFHHLRRRWGWFISTAIVSFIFAAMHPQGWTVMPVLASIAIVLAALREWRGCIAASMTAHALNNFIATTIALLLLR
jgi:membrane protease YdiL (CAAX protease family)